jgi:hypothetical protein
MSESFGSVGDDNSNQGTGQEPGTEGTNFGQNTDGQTKPNGADQGIDHAEYEALRQRDEHAQKHIQRLESENSELRDKVVELEDKLASATTLDEALKRISNQGEGQDTSLDRTDVAQVVEEILGQKQTKERMESNWQEVVSDLTKAYGDWKTADLKVQERAQELDISLEEATMMARNNPKAFRTLFNLQNQQTSSNPAGSHGAGAMGQRGVSSQPGQLRNQAYYSNLRKNDPNKYWSVDVQAQMRRDLFKE